MLRTLALSFIIFHLSFSPLGAQSLTFVELNCENLFDTHHDEGKQDMEWTPGGKRRWTPRRYWRKVNNVARAILSSGGDAMVLPDLVALCEVENDTVLHDLTRRSLLRGAGYEYLMTESPDVRGIDVALLYQPATFLPLCYECLVVPTLPSMRPTRDVLHVVGRLLSGDTLHVFVVHAPSRYGGERASRPYRLQVASVVGSAVGSLLQADSLAKIIVAGDFNDYADSPALQRLARHGLANVSQNVKGQGGRALATYRYQGEWRSLDHLLVSPALRPYVLDVVINDASFLLEAEDTYGGWRPRRTYNGFRYRSGFSDHLPLIARFRFDDLNIIR